MDIPKNYSCDPAHWVDIYSDELYRYALSRVGKVHDAEDIVQETFFSALRGLDSFRHDCTEKTWLYNILKNKIVDYYRKASRNPEVRMNGGEGEFYQNYFGTEGHAKGKWRESAAPKMWEFNADKNLHSKEFMAVFSSCLAKLPAQYSAVFTLRNIDDKSTEEICKELEITASNLWVIIHRAKLQLRRCLEINWFN